MGSGSTPSILRGLVVPDPRFRWSPTVTATSQAGPSAGVPVPSDTTELVLNASGSMTKGIDIKTVRGGHPGPDGGAFVWRHTSDASDEWRGWDPPSSITGFEYLSRSAVADKWRRPHMAALADGTVIIVVGKDKQQTACWYRDPATGGWTESEVWDPGSAYSVSEPHPCAVELPNGRVLCFMWEELSASAYQIRTYYSDDSGANWLPAQKGTLATPIDASTYTPGRLRAAYLNGQIALFVGLTVAGSDEIHQYASNDLGATFATVGVELAGGPHDVVEVGGSLLLAYASATASSGSTYPPRVRVIGSAFASAAAADSVVAQDDTDAMEWTTASASTGDMTAIVDDDGAVYLIGRDMVTGVYDLHTRRSVDGGATWAAVGAGAAAGGGVSMWRGRDGNTYPVDVAACTFRGTALVAHRYKSSPDATDDSLAVMALGGYTSVCIPQQSGGAPSATNVTGWTVTWLPYDFPEDVGNTVPVWTASSTGTPSLGSLGMRLITGVAQTEYRISTGMGGTIAEGLLVLAEVRVESGQARIELRVSDATPLEYEVAALVSTTEIKLWDLKAGAVVGSATSTTDADGAFVQVLVELSNAKARMWYRPIGTGYDRKWTEVAATAALTSAAANNGHRVRFGQTDSSDTYWRLCCYASDQYTGERLYAQTNWNDLLGRSFMPSAVYVNDGTSVSAADGPTFRNEDWTISPAYAFGVENLFPDVAASPQREWRATDETQQDITWQVGSAVTLPMGALAAVYIGDGNFGLAELDGQDAGGSWTAIATIDRRAQTSMDWTLSDRLLQPQTVTGTSAPFYLPTNILAGSYFALDGAGEGKKVRKITTNSPGVWTPNTTSHKTRILLEGLDGTEGTTGTSGELWMKDSLTIVPLATKYKAFRLRIAAQDTAEGYLKAGTVLFGHFYPLGAYVSQYGWGRTLEWATNTETVEGRSGIRTVQSLGKTRRAVEVSWVDGVDTTDLYGDANPNWVLGWTSGGAVAVPVDAPLSIPGLIEALQGNTTPVAYAAAIKLPPDGTTPITLLDRTLMLYGRVASDVIQNDVAVGDEGSSEVMRLGTCRIEEEV